MKAMILIGGVIALAAAVIVVACQKASEPAAPAAAMPPPSAAANAPAADMPAQKVCPVMGNPIDPSIYADHNGRRIYFCCPACVNTFKNDPDKYVKKVDEELKGRAGATGETHEH
ncbi:MAG: hypothetical protein V2A58_05540 [Planctomycetota bacterium]